MKKDGQKKEKQYFLVEVDVLSPITIKYRVLAESPEEALELAPKSPVLEAPRPRLSISKKIKARVYVFGTHLLKLSKNF
jgi:hypothetical protein